MNENLKQFDLPEIRSTKWLLQQIKQWYIAARKRYGINRQIN